MITLWIALVDMISSGIEDAVTNIITSLGFTEKPEKIRARPQYSLFLGVNTVYTMARD